MITYDFEHIEGPIYAHVYKCIKNDILEGNLKPGQKLPSKRTFARNNGISTITIQNAYDQLISEGYVYTLPKKGYYVANISGMVPRTVSKEMKYDINIPKTAIYKYDFSSNGVDSDNFPFSIWARLSREVMSDNKDELMKISPTSGVRQLREAIAEHLKSFRGMLVDPDQIVIGAGTEYLYGLLVQLIGKDKKYAIENPGYKKLALIYQHQKVDYGYVSMDEKGVTVDSLNKSRADIAHICPNHHFPTGITMPASRRYEILSWANEQNERYIVEDDYDSEFRLEGKPIPPLFSIDACEKVIYMNTFSKSLTPTIRISYMVLPAHLINRFYEEMSFYSCTVSNFEQFTLARFISGGYLEKHINRMRLYYTRKRQSIIEVIEKSNQGSKFHIIENDSGLHFLLKIETKLSDVEVERKLEKNGIKIRALSDYYFTKEECRQHLFLVNYSNLSSQKVFEAMQIIKDI